LTAARYAARRRQRIPGNWKLMQENIRTRTTRGCSTPFVTFGLWRARQVELVMDARHRHAAMISTRGRAARQRRYTGSNFRRT
jgi:salicylate 5-hydroxylase large subunit